MSGSQSRRFEPEEAQLHVIDEEEKKDNLLEESSTGKGNFLDKIRCFFSNHKSNIFTGVIVVLNILVFVYFGFATHFFTDQACSTAGSCDMGWCNGYGFLIILMIVVYGGLIYFQIIKRFFGKEIATHCLSPFMSFIKKLFNPRFVRIGGVLLLLVGFVIYMVYETSDNRDRLRGFIGIGVTFLFGFLFSKHPSHINWRPILMGMTLQFFLGLVCIRWDVGRSIFDCLGKKLTTFLAYGLEGAKFVYGEFLIVTGVIAFAGLSVILFIGCIVAILYYLGAMQWLLKKMGWALQSILGTTVCESMNAAANIFLGQAEAPLIIRPYIKKLTLSELHAVMTSGFATASGTVLAVYISFGANPSYLITATVMAASGSLCFSKLFYPETEESLTTAENFEIAKSTDSSILDAATNGALAGMTVILGIIANMIAFVSLIAFADGFLNFFGYLVGAEDISLVFLIGKILMPITWAMGVPVEDCEKIGQLLAIKTVVNAIFGYQLLGEAVQEGLENPDVALHPRSVAICTYAMCSFANPAAVGIQIGGLGSMAPEKLPAITAVAVRALISGVCVCFITGSIAGILMPESMFIEMTNIVKTNTTAGIYAIG